jgi:hypothetical protein
MLPAIRLQAKVSLLLPGSRVTVPLAVQCLLLI